MPIQLVVVRPFADYAKGEVITDEETISMILASQNAPNVVRVRVASTEG